MDRANRGRQVLAEGLQRTEEPRLARHPDRGGRRLARLSRSDRDGLSGRADPDLHRARDPQFADAGELEGPQAAGCGYQADLPGRHRRGGGSGARRLCRQRVGPQISDYRGDVAAPMGTGDSLFRLSARGASNRLHNQCDREHAHAAAQDCQEPGPLPKRRSRQQTAVSGLAQHREGLEDAAYHLAASRCTVRHSVRRAIHQRHQLRFLNRPRHTRFRTGPIRPGKPQQNAYVERFNRTVRSEWLSQYYWDDLAHVQHFATEWMWQYNHERPNMGLCGVTPKQRLTAAA
ncbi:hypothetical protein BURKHO8Y_180075 [Burkholderia sp. 8Y]|nr:hypothetical protein BURKHO8Y_180075 [Burkholderia sp. 8Y]